MADATAAACLVKSFILLLDLGMVVSHDVRHSLCNLMALGFSARDWESIVRSVREKAQPIQRVSAGFLVYNHCWPIRAVAILCFYELIDLDVLYDHVPDNEIEVRAYKRLFDYAKSTSPIDVTIEYGC